jgi:hypothetical protein
MAYLLVPNAASQARPRDSIDRGEGNFGFLKVPLFYSDSPPVLARRTVSRVMSKLISNSLPVFRCWFVSPPQAMALDEFCTDNPKDAICTNSRWPTRSKLVPCKLCHCALMLRGWSPPDGPVSLSLLSLAFRATTLRCRLHGEGQPVCQCTGLLCRPRAGISSRRACLHVVSFWPYANVIIICGPITVTAYDLIAMY